MTVVVGYSPDEFGRAAVEQLPERAVEHLVAEVGAEVADDHGLRARFDLLQRGEVLLDLLVHDEPDPPVPALGGGPGTTFEVTRDGDTVTIRRTAIDEGMDSLRDDGARKVLEGHTTVEEVLAATQDDVG